MRRLFRRPDFLRYWCAATASLMGSNVSGFAFPTIAIAVLSATAWQMALINTVQALAFPVLGIAVATWVEHHSKQRVMLCTDVARALAMAAVPVLLFTHHLTIATLLGLSAFAAVLGVFRDIASQSLLPALVEGDQLLKGNVSLELSNNASLSAGPALAGVLTTLFGAPWALVVDTIGYLMSAFSVRGIAVEARAPLSQRTSFVSEMLEGLRFVWSSRDLVRMVGATATLNLASAAGQIVSMLFFYRTLHATPLQLGFVLAFSNAGLLGAWLTPALRARLGLYPLLALALGVCAAGRLLLPFATATPLPLLVAAVASVISSFWLPLFNVVQVAYRQEITPLPLQARIHATVRTINASTIPIGAALGGLVASAIGVEATLVCTGLVTGCAVLWFIPARFFGSSRNRRSVRALPG